MGRNVGILSLATLVLVGAVVLAVAPRAGDVLAQPDAAGEAGGAARSYVVVFEECHPVNPCAEPTTGARGEEGSDGADGEPGEGGKGGTGCEGTSVSIASPGSCRGGDDGRPGEP